MPSPPYQNPFLDPDTNKPSPPRPPTPPLPPIPPRSASRPHTSLVSVSSPASTNSSFEHVANPNSYSTLSTVPPREREWGWSNNPYHAALPAGNARDKRDRECRQTNPATSARSAESSIGSNSTTLVSRSHPFAPSYPPGHDVNKNSTSTYTYEGPFADPKPVAPQSYRPRPKAPPRPPTTISERSIPVVRPMTGSRIAVRDFAATTDIPLNDLKPPTTTIPRRRSRTIEDIENARSKAALSYPNHNPFRTPKQIRTRSKHEIHREIRMREAAKRQNQLLELERARTLADIYPQIPRLHPSPRLTNSNPQYTGNAVHRSQSTSSGSGLILSGDGRPRSGRSLAKNPLFWMFFTVLHIGIVSTSAALAVILRDKRAGTTARVGGGMIFWLICSIVACLVGVVGTACIWGKDLAWCTTARKAFGFGGQGFSLTSNHGRSESAVQRGFRERNEEDRRMLGRLERVRERERERLQSEGEGAAKGLGERVDSMSSVRTVDPMWQALYSTPEELRARRPKDIMTEPRQWQDGQGLVEAGLRSCSDKEKRKIAGVKSFNVSNESQTYDEVDIGTQLLSPNKRTSLKSRTHSGQTPQRVGSFSVSVRASEAEIVDKKGFTTQPTQGRNLKERFQYSRLSSNKKKQTGHNKHYQDEPKAIPSHPIISTTSPVNIPPSITSSITTITLPNDNYTPRNKPPLSTQPHSPILPLSPTDASYLTTYGDTKVIYNANPFSNPRPLPDINSQLNSAPVPNLNNNSNTALHAFSPLEHLARELNTPELRSLSAQERHGYFVERRVESKERGRKVRLSLERVNSISSGSAGGGRRGSKIIEMGESSFGKSGEIVDEVEESGNDDQDDSNFFDGRFSGDKADLVEKGKVGPEEGELLGEKRNVRRLLKPIVQERVEGFEKRSMDSGRGGTGKRSVSGNGESAEARIKEAVV